YFSFQRHDKSGKYNKVPHDSPNAEPMRRALNKLSGIIIDRDYRGKKVLAAYEWIDYLNWGVVAKIDMDEITEPFITAGIISSSAAIILVILGSILFNRITNPLIKKIRENEKRAQDFLDIAGVMILALNADGEIILINKKGCDILECNNDTLIGKNWIENFIPPESRREIHEVFNRVVGGEIAFLEDYQNEILTKSGKRKIISWHNSLLTDENGNCLSVLSSGEDITERLQIEMSNTENIRKLEEINQELEAFSYSVSHDLREPLRTMASFCTFLKTDIGENLPEKAEQDIHFIIDASTRMQRMVDDILQLSRAGKSQLNMEPVDLNDCMAQLNDSLKALIEEHHTTLSWNKLPVVLGDHTAIHRVLLNLINNAIKFHGENDPNVSVTAQKNNGKWEISVSDNGIGINTKNINDIFRPFKRLHAIKDYEGSGIGLSIVKKIIQRHGGDIKVMSQPGEGSKFTFTLKDAG
ncbi:MAG: ATP-binding protein, partial [Spirochaetota bacterium]|nr:ATP-binding protein [Spirochaetota bacterium]